MAVIQSQYLGVRALVVSMLAHVADSSQWRCLCSRCRGREVSKATFYRHLAETKSAQARDGMMFDIHRIESNLNEDVEAKAQDQHSDDQIGDHVIRPPRKRSGDETPISAVVV